MLQNRQLTVADVPNDDTHLVNWGAVLTNVIGLCLGALALTTFGGVTYMVFKFPSQQDKILKNQEMIMVEVKGLMTRMDRNEQLDGQQNQMMLRLPAR
jgi:hypothetical protein